MTAAERAATSRNIRARVWSTGTPSARTWHYKVMRSDGATVLYDNTGSFSPMLTAALIRVTALRHMQTAGHKLKEYRP